MNHTESTKRLKINAFLNHSRQVSQGYRTTVAENYYFKQTLRKKHFIPRLRYLLDKHLPITILNQGWGGRSTAEPTSPHLSTPPPKRKGER
jgi:hypothetical protein